MPQSVFLSIFLSIIENRVCLEICFSGMCEEKKNAVCLCVALLDMMRDDIMADAAAAVAVR